MPGIQALPTLCQRPRQLLQPQRRTLITSLPRGFLVNQKSQFTHHFRTPDPPRDPPPVANLLQRPKESSSAPSSQKPPQLETHSSESQPFPATQAPPMAAPPRGSSEYRSLLHPSSKQMGSCEHRSLSYPRVQWLQWLQGGILGTRHLESCTEFRPQLHLATCWLQFPIPCPTALKVQAASSACRGLCELRFLAHSDGCGHWWLLGSRKLP